MTNLPLIILGIFAYLAIGVMIARWQMDGHSYDGISAACWVALWLLIVIVSLPIWILLFASDLIERLVKWRNP